MTCKTVCLTASMFQDEGNQDLWKHMCEDLGLDPEKVTTVNLHIPDDPEHIEVVE